MRLINVHTKKLEEFFDAHMPSYSILSHTWGTEEVSMAEYISTGFDLGKGRFPSNKHGFHKIEYACDQSKTDGLDYTWVDTCCIDKSSSADLVEAINSMYTWYENSTHCYAYVEDVVFEADSDGQALWEVVIPRLCASRWFTRGWTLQELLAPRDVRFYAKDWAYLGTKGNFYPYLAETTGIDGEVLTGVRAAQSFSVAQRMGWAVGRQTSRMEDTAYCLLGLFGINMPLLYGEGRKAFIRLQEEIIKVNDDTTIFLWNHMSDVEATLLLAPHPDRFKYSAEYVRPGHTQSNIGHTMGNTGLQIELAVHESLFPGFYLTSLGGATTGAEHDTYDRAYIWLQLFGSDNKKPPRYFVSSPDLARIEEGERWLRKGFVKPEMVVLARTSPTQDRKPGLANDLYNFSVDDQLAYEVHQSNDIFPKTERKFGFDPSTPVPPTKSVNLITRRLRYAALTFRLRARNATKVGLSPDDTLVVVFGKTDINQSRPNLLGIMKQVSEVDWFVSAAHLTMMNPENFTTYPSHMHSAPKITHEIRVFWSKEQLRTINIVLQPRRPISSVGMKIPFLSSTRK